MDVTGDEHATRLREPFKPGRNVDPVTVKVLSVDDHVADVNSDAKQDALRGRLVSRALRDSILNGDGAPHGVNRTGELDQRTVACKLDQPTSVAGDRRIYDVAPCSLKAGERAFLVRRHQP